MLFFVLQLCGYGVAHFVNRGEHTEECEQAPVYDLFIVHKDFEFSVVSVLELDFLAKRFAYLGRRTSGLNTCDSIPAAADPDRHVTSCCVQLSGNFSAINCLNLGRSLMFARSESVRYHTPYDVHFGLAEARRADRAKVLAAAYADT